jgi:hypothetical protein
MKKKQDDQNPAAQLERARAELDSAQQELQSFNVHRGDLSEVATRRRELAERVEIAKERLQLAEQRAAEIEFSEAESRIAELQEQSRQIESELVVARESAADELRQHLNSDWLAGSGRFASQPPALPGLLGYCNSVSEVEGRRDAVLNEIRALERRVSERRAQLDRDAAAARTDARRKLIGGDAVSLDLVPWRIVAAPGFTSDIADNLERRAIPCALVDPRQREIHALLPPDSQPGGWCDGFQVESAEPMKPGDLCEPMADAFRRSRGGHKASR